MRTLRESWDVVLGIFGLCGVTGTWLAPALGAPELQTVAAWVIFGSASGILPANRGVEWLLQARAGGGPGK